MKIEEFKTLNLEQFDFVSVKYKSKGKEILEAAHFHHVDSKGRLHAKLTNWADDWLCVYLSSVESVKKIKPATP